MTIRRVPPTMELWLGADRADVDSRLSIWRDGDFKRRLLGKDPRIWFPEPVPGIIDRLGWLDLPRTMSDRIEELEGFAAEIRSEGTEKVVLLGMGGSSLAPEVFQATFGSAPGFPELIVLDTTHPSSVLEVDRSLDLERTLFIVSSKSGTTLETLSLFRYFWDRVSVSLKAPGRRFATVTDPGSPLLGTARERRFRRVFEAPPDVGGRFSALSEFGLLPAALIGADIRSLLERAETVLEDDVSTAEGHLAAGFTLGAVLGELSPRRNKLTFETSPSLKSFPAWIEQLIAESLGKEGKGIVPVLDEPRSATRDFGADRLFIGLFLEEKEGRERPGDRPPRDSFSKDRRHPFIRFRLADLYDVGGQMVQWEIAAAAAGAVMGVHPFDQPDVQLAKELARKAMSSDSKSGEEAPEATVPQPVAVDDSSLPARLDAWLRPARPGDYVGLQAYLPPGPDVSAALRSLRRTVLDRTGLATTSGYGPRFLHSTGQLHKGGPDSGLFLQIVDLPERDVPVPETDFTFARLIRAQALGDLAALHRRGRRVLSIDIGRTGVGGIERLNELLQAS